jgi:hypothetical protein
LYERNSGIPDSHGGGRPGVAVQADNVELNVPLDETVFQLPEEIKEIASEPQPQKMAFSHRLRIPPDTRPACALFEN